MRHIQAVLFDLDSTLMDDFGALEKAWGVFQTGCEQRGLSGDWGKLRLVYERHAWEQWTLGDNPRRHDAPETILEKAWVLTLEEEPREGFPPPRVLAKDFVACLEASWCLYEDVPPVLNDLTRRVPLAVVTNGGVDFQGRKFKRLGLDRWFKSMLVSEACGSTKPDSAIFLTACRRLDVAPEHCLMVGDSLERDVEGALNAGLKVVWLDRSGKGPSVKLPQGAGYISSLAELAI